MSSVVARNDRGRMTFLGIFTVERSCPNAQAFAFSASMDACDSDGIISLEMICFSVIKNKLNIHK
jgi:hypothetical protein